MTSVAEFLSVCLTQNHANQLPKLFSENKVFINNQAVIGNDLLTVGQQVTIDIYSHEEELVPTDWKLIWENEELMVVFKPHGLPVSRTTRNLYLTLISIIRRETPYFEAQLLHRLDTETSGLILIAKNKASDRKWKPKLNQLISRKIYQAWVQGCPDWEETTLECDLSEKVGSEIRSQMYVVPDKSCGDYLKPKAAKTAFRVVKRCSKGTLVECELFSGRKHQIRASLAYLGHPVIGDKIYSYDGVFYLKRLESALKSADYNQLGAQYQLLCANCLELNTGTTCVKLEVDWNLPVIG